jgi:hypothetical protein
VETARCLKHFRTRTKKKMVRVREDYPRIVEKKVAWLDRLDRRLRPYGHEDRCLHIAMCKMQNTAPCLRTGIARDDIKLTYFILFQNGGNYTIFRECVRTLAQRVKSAM